ncbi:MAG TPA: helix-turn-helix domain-containing protein [Kiritimatiellia bacterium]|nr:helix-turn-helix domain-containing protein [Kiritimatiellia bacterium]HMP00627.1 helix-turn-helix domain-containing protein [Kiritimatiellia bacterium]HMP97684.1 helix-turn-helix domain-containing protein [Kiritimatiellia bacterium]
MKKKFLSLNERAAYHSLEDVVGCKWSAGVVAALAEGVSRPGELERYIPGISKKILNERLRKLLDYRLITRSEIPGRVPHVAYALTGTGRKLARVIGQLKQLDQAHRESR